MATITLATNVNTFSSGSDFPMRAVFGSASGYVPSGNQTGLLGDEVWVTPVLSSPVSVIPGVLQYQFLVPTTVPIAFTFGEMLLTNATGSSIYAVGVLDMPLSRGAGESVDCILYFDMRSPSSVTAFGNTQGAVTMPSVPFYRAVNTLPPASQTKSMLAITSDPVNPQDSLIASVSYANPDIANDFTSWSITDYAMVSFGTVTSVVGNNVQIPLHPPTNLTLSTGQYLFQTSNFIAVCPSLAPSTNGLQTVIPLSNYQSTLVQSGTPYKLFEYSSMNSDAVAFINQLQVTPAQINQVATLNPERVMLTDGSRAMLSSLNFGGFKGINLGNPEVDTDASNMRAMSATSGLVGVTTEGMLNELSELAATVEGLQSAVNLLMAWALSGTGGVGAGGAANANEVFSTQTTLTAGQIITSAITGGVPNTTFTISVDGVLLNPGNPHLSLDANGAWTRTSAPFPAAGTFVQTLTFAANAHVINTTYTVAPSMNKAPWPLIQVYDHTMGTGYLINTTHAFAYTYGDNVEIVLSSGVPNGKFEIIQSGDVFSGTFDADGKFVTNNPTSVINPVGAYPVELFFYDSVKSEESKSDPFLYTLTVLEAAGTPWPVLTAFDVTRGTSSVVSNETHNFWYTFGNSVKVTITGGVPNGKVDVVQGPNGSHPGISSSFNLDSTGAHVSTNANATTNPVGSFTTTYYFYDAAGSLASKSVPLVITTTVLGSAATPIPLVTSTDVEADLTQVVSTTPYVQSYIYGHRNTLVISGGVPNGKVEFLGSGSGTLPVFLTLNSSGSVTLDTPNATGVPVGSHKCTLWFYDAIQSAASKSAPLKYTVIVMDALSESGVATPIPTITVTLPETSNTYVVSNAPYTYTYQAGARVVFSVSGGVPNGKMEHTNSTDSILRVSQLDADGAYALDAVSALDFTGTFTTTLNFYDAAGSLASKSSSLTVTATVTATATPAAIAPTIGTVANITVSAGRPATITFPTSNSSGAWTATVVGGVAANSTLSGLTSTKVDVTKAVGAAVGSVSNIILSQAASGTYLAATRTITATVVSAVPMFTASVPAKGQSTIVSNPPHTFTYVAGDTVRFAVTGGISYGKYTNLNSTDGILRNNTLDANGAATIEAVASYVGSYTTTAYFYDAQGSAASKSEALVVNITGTSAVPPVASGTPVPVMQVVSSLGTYTVSSAPHSYSAHTEAMSTFTITGGVPNGKFEIIDGPGSPTPGATAVYTLNSSGYWTSPMGPMPSTAMSFTSTAYFYDAAKSLASKSAPLVITHTSVVQPVSATPVPFVRCNTVLGSYLVSSAPWAYTTSPNEIYTMVIEGGVPNGKVDIIDGPTGPHPGVVSTATLNGSGYAAIVTQSPSTASVYTLTAYFYDANKSLASKSAPLEVTWTNVSSMNAAIIASVVVTTASSGSKQLNVSPTYTSFVGETINYTITGGVPNGHVDIVDANGGISPIVLNSSGGFTLSQITPNSIGTHTNTLYFYDANKSAASKSAGLVTYWTIVAMPHMP